MCICVRVYLSHISICNLVHITIFRYDFFFVFRCTFTYGYIKISNIQIYILDLVTRFIFGKTCAFFHLYLTCTLQFTIRRQAEENMFFFSFFASNYSINESIFYFGICSQIHAQIHNCSSARSVYLLSGI